MKQLSLHQPSPMETFSPRAGPSLLSIDHTTAFVPVSAKMFQISWPTKQSVAALWTGRKKLSVDDKSIFFFFSHPSREVVHRLN